jgi:hypothetical protein
MMSGKPVVIGTLRKLAKALDVTVESLLDGFVELPPQMPLPKRGEVTFTVGADFDEVKAIVQAFVEMLKHQIPMPGAIIVKDAKQGSIIITLEMDEKDIVSLAETFLALRGTSPIKTEGDWFVRKDIAKDTIYVFVGGKPSSMEDSGFNAASEQLGALRCITSMQLPDSPTLPDELRGKTLKLIE